MWYPFKTTARFMREDAARDRAIKAGWAAVDIARTKGVPEDDVIVIGDAVVDTYYDSPQTLRSYKESTFATNLANMAFSGQMTKLINDNQELVTDAAKCAVAIRLVDRTLRERYLTVPQFYPAKDMRS